MPRTKGAIADRWWTEAVKMAVNRDSDEVDDDGKKKKRINLIADKLCKMAIDGDMGAIKEIGDRLEGRPKQAVDVAGSEKDGSIGITFKTVIEK